MRARTPALMDDAGRHALYDRDWTIFVQPERDEATIELGQTFENIASIADMSAGGAQITPLIAAHYGVTPYLGDFGNVYGYRFQGTLQETVPQLPVVDLYVCSETLEHLDDPDDDLRLIRKHCRNLLLTTPVCEHDVHTELTEQTEFHGHLWVWKREDVEEMLVDAGFEVIEFRQVLMFGLWKAR